MQEELPTISVIIPTYNSERTLDQCLRSIVRQDYPRNKIEIVVVDGYSKDKTLEIAKKSGVDKIIYDPSLRDQAANHVGKTLVKSGRAEARNIGAQVSKGKYILFLDSDMILSKSVIRECVNKLENDETKVALYIPERIVGKGFWIKVRDFERSFYNATCIDAVRFIRRDIFEKVGGFDQRLIGGEDWDLDRRIRRLGGVAVARSPLYHNEGDFDIREYLAKKRHYSETLNNYISKWGKDDPVVRKQLGGQYRLIMVFIEHGKWKKLLKYPILTIAMFLLKFQVGLEWMVKRNFKST